MTTRCICTTGQRYQPVYFMKCPTRNLRFKCVTDIVFHCLFCRCEGNSMGIVQHLPSCIYKDSCEHTIINYESQENYPYKHEYCKPMKNNEFIVKMATIRLSYTQHKMDGDIFIKKYIEMEKASVEKYILLKTNRVIIWE
jgi:hypothetical protein